MTLSLKQYGVLQTKHHIKTLNMILNKAAETGDYRYWYPLVREQEKHITWFLQIAENGIFAIRRGRIL